jgi:hypothetical protein
MFVSPEIAVIITPADNSEAESMAGKYLERENPQPQTHPNRNNVLNNRKSIDRKNKSNSPGAKLSRRIPSPANSIIKTRKDGRNLNLNE